MNFKIFRLLSLFIVLLLLVSCATFVFFHAEVDKEFVFKANPKIFLYEKHETSVADKNISKILIEEFKREGVALVSNINDADLVLQYSVFAQAGIGYGYVLAPEIGFEYPNTIPYTTTGSWYYRPIPVNYPYDVRGLQIRLFNAEKFKEGKREAVWEGYLSTNKYTFTTRVRDCIALMLDYFGKPHEGSARLYE